MRVRQEDENGIVLTLQDGTEVSIRVSGSELFLFIEKKSFVVRPGSSNMLRIGFEDVPRSEQEAGGAPVSDPARERHWAETSD